MKGRILDALQAHAEGNVELHLANIEVYLDNPAGIGEHSDILEAIQAEMDKIAVHQDRLDIIKKYLEV
jgi:hypothetical protein|tara:strand:+ start:282 stop:485 length:204 start_codon:yes stop_codon:yes gene_type:complete